MTDDAAGESRPGALVREEHRDHATWLTLDRPERLNVFTGAGYDELGAAVDRAAADPATRVVVLTGTGRAFSAGADRSLVDGTATPDERRRAGEGFTALIEAVGRCETPIVAAVNGLAVGVGCTILLQCDLVLAARSARFRFPFTALGIVPEAGSSVLLPARARWGDAAWALLSSEWIDAPAACEMGLAWRAVPDADLVAETTRVAATIAAVDPAAVAATKRLLTAGRAELVRAAMAREQAAMGALLARGDA
ncbi:MAG TPA: enoyl-CoA hydratase/isomerase family protein [Acidimicrobiales bacterium]|nr:enoyl-CoA hydratase/isomerase family protein [Acidimicrobiales bacterium]